MVPSTAVCIFIVRRRRELRCGGLKTYKRKQAVRIVHLLEGKMPDEERAPSMREGHQEDERSSATDNTAEEGQGREARTTERPHNQGSGCAIEGVPNFEDDEEEDAENNSEDMTTLGDREWKTWVHPSGDFYQGQMDGDARDGFGRYYWATGSQYEGQWKDGSKCGFGRWVSASGNLYIGSFKNDKPDGLGYYRWRAGQWFSGNWARGQVHGFGWFGDGRGSVVAGIFDNGSLSRAVERSRAGQRNIETLVEQTFRDSTPTPSTEIDMSDRIPRAGSLLSYACSRDEQKQNKIPQPPSPDANE